MQFMVTPNYAAYMQSSERKFGHGMYVVSEWLEEGLDMDHFFER
jgi:hypothetical protein